MKPIVAIVGRPNVGKSTLFNRISGRRKAIVDDMPGVTRDRNYIDVTWDDRTFTLIDTGGFEPESKEDLLTQMKEQAMLAIEEADLIIFLADGKEGLMPADSEVADLLRRSEKPLVFVVNKIDSQKRMEGIYDFYSLGLPEPLPVSAEHGIGTGELMERVLSLIPEYREEPLSEDVTRLAVIGRPNVGKSSLINKLLGYERVIVSDIPGTTRDAIDTLLTIERPVANSTLEASSGISEPGPIPPPPIPGGKGEVYTKQLKKYLLIDTAGIRKKGRVSQKLEKFTVVQALRSMERCDVVLLLIDAVEGVTEQDTKVAGYAHEKGKGCVIVVNKWDLIEKETKTYEKYVDDVRFKLKYLAYAPVISISALTGQRAVKVLDVVDKVSAECNKRIGTGVLNRAFEDMTKGHLPGLFRNRTVKFYYITQTSVKPPTFTLFTNFPEGVHFSYERYLENKLREAFGFEGTPIRLQFRKRGK
ncbi:MAG TPA: ribosome biogenesis GTPase Der [Thermodesulfobacteriota bacterium]|nr:ribosome biogenesis GTPase Der [Thermodesulfobacteriota bacterium]